MIRPPDQLSWLRQKEGMLLLLVVLLMSAGAIVWILNTLAIIPGSWSTLLSVIFTVLSVMFTFLQWYAQITGARRRDAFLPEAKRQKEVSEEQRNCDLSRCSSENCCVSVAQGLLQKTMAHPLGWELGEPGALKGKGISP
jgi:hypothetical protein